MFEAFVKAVEETFERNVGMTVRPIDVGDAPPDNRPAPKDVSAIIGFTGGYQGMVILSFPSVVAAQIVELCVGEPIVEEEEIADAVSEFLNMISGSAKRSLTAAGRPVEMSLPTVVIGRNHRVFQQSDKPCMRIDFESDVGKFYIQMSLEKVVRATRVVITDDSRLSRRIMRNALMNLDQKVEFIECSDGARARRTLEELSYNIDLLVLDMKLPNYNGIDLFRALRVTPNDKTIPILMVTSDQTAERQIAELASDLQKSLEPYKLLLKPYEADIARTMARELIDYSHARPSRAG